MKKVNFEKVSELSPNPRYICLFNHHKFGEITKLDGVWCFESHGFVCHSPKAFRKLARFLKKINKKPEQKLKFKSCPFCGESDIVIAEKLNLAYCNSCSAETNINDWNTRVLENKGEK